MNKIPPWILVGAVVLAFCAGMLNATALMGFTHVSVSHVTGNISMIANTLVHKNWGSFSLFLISIGSFWAGSVISGAIIGTSRLTYGKHYGLAMAVEFVLLLISLLLFLKESLWGQMLLAMACGLQNSMVTTYDGIVVRTTHLTGVTSDLGAMVGRWLVGHGLSKKKVIVQSAIWWGFFAGGIVAVFGFDKIGYFVMLIPMIIILLSALFYHRLGRLFHHTERLLKLHKLKHRRSLDKKP